MVGMAIEPCNNAPSGPAPGTSLGSDYKGDSDDCSRKRSMGKQATLIIGLIGHVAHGKTTVVKALTGVRTTRHKKELERNITMKLGYANAKIFKCSNPDCPRPGCYRSHGSSQPDEFDCDQPGCHGMFQLVRQVSFVDCPGHGALMATMLNGTSAMDGALMVVAANERFPQPQTSEHLIAVEMLKLKNLVIVQNKIDLADSMEEVCQQQINIREFVKGTVAENAPIIPVSAQMQINMDVLCEYLLTKFPQPKRNVDCPPMLSVIRSFDINKPGPCKIDDLKGGVLGGNLSTGTLKVGDAVEIRPGLVSKDEKGNMTGYRPIKTKIMSLLSEQNHLEKVFPGGLIGVGTTIDPQFTQGDRLVGHCLGSVGSLPNVYSKLEILCHLLKRVHGSEDGFIIDKIKRHETLLVNVGSHSSTCRVISVDGKHVKISLQNAVCTDIGKSLTISRLIDHAWRLIGWAEVVRGMALQQQ